MILKVVFDMYFNSQFWPNRKQLLAWCEGFNPSVENTMESKFSNFMVQELSIQEQKAVKGGADYYTVWVYDADGCHVSGESYSFSNYADASNYAARMRQTGGVAAVSLIGYNFK